MKAISTVAAGLMCEVHIKKITRCSNTEATLADCLSKAAFNKFWNIAKLEKLTFPLDMAKVPKVLMKWILNPKTDDSLGHRILKELAQETSILSYNC